MIFKIKIAIRPETIPRYINPRDSSPPPKYKIIVTDNAISKDLKTKLESSFKNVEVITPNFNLGNGGGINFALKKINTKYALYLDIDTSLEIDTIDKLIKVANF